RPSPAAERDEAGHALAAMKRLVEFSGAVMREEKPERLFKLLLEAVVDLTGAEKGFVLVLRDNERQLAAAHNVGKESLDITRISDTIVDQVIKLRRPVIVSDAMNDRKFARARSVVDLKVTSVMCVPLLYRNDLLGVLYLGNDAVTGLFTEDDLAILQVWASQASMVMHAAIMLNELKVTNRNLREALRRRAQGAMIGSSPRMKEVFRVIRRVAPTDLSVLVLGETGTGKELVAQAIHRHSSRADGPFVKVNCAALPENLLESELFGHERGAFTGADRQRVGRFELASGGTLFLDEIGTMSAGTQAKVLRVLQEREFERLGGTRTIRADVRILAATNRDLEEAVEAGEFREDLYYRLNVVTIRMPPLRERKEDIVPLARHFLQRFALDLKKPIRGLSPAAIRVLQRHNWPGNIRELENTIERAVLMADGDVLEPEDLTLGGHAEGGEDHSRRSSILRLPAEGIELEELERMAIIEALKMNDWVQKDAAKFLGISSRVMNYKIQKYEITHPRWTRNRA
ncbi:MAG: GAF domain-containing protein, partial [Acidobacteria bacterium]